MESRSRKRSSTQMQPEYERDPQRRRRTPSNSNPAHRNSVIGDFVNRGLSLIGLGKSEDPRDDTHRYEARPPMAPVTEEQNDYNRLRQNETTRGDPSSRLFHDKLDLCSESEIIDDCETLNSKIREAALNLTEEWEKSQSSSRGRWKPLSNDARSYLKSVLGKNIYYDIKRRSSPAADNQTAVADALQGLAVNAAFKIISTKFCPGLPQRVDEWMQKIFENMLTAESQAAALRWRAMTYTHANDEAVIKIFTDRLISDLSYGFSNVFILAGQRSSSSFLSSTRMEQSIRDSEIIDHALLLSRKLVLSFFSVHLDVFMIERGMMFREDMMDYDDEIVPGKDIVSCTLELGIREIPSPKQAQESRGRILVRPKVQLQVLDTY